jgi:hypothetical protein
MSMCVHAGGRYTTLDEVTAVIPPPSTRSWDPMPHSEVIDLIQNEIPKVGLQIVGFQHALRDRKEIKGSQYFGLLSVRDVMNRGLESPDMELQIGIRNSVDKSLAAALVAGTKVFVCDNLAFSGEVALNRKHTSNIRRDISDKVKSAFVKLLNLFGSQKEQIDGFKVREITDADRDRLTTLVMRNGIMPPSRFKKLEEQFASDDPAACGGIQEPTLWRFMNAVTQVLKKDHPDVLVPRTGKLFELCRSYV